MTTEISPSMSGVISMLTNCRGSGAGAFARAWYVKGHEALRLAPPAPEISGGGAQGGGLLEIINQEPMSTRHSREEGTGLVTIEDMDVETRARGRLFERPEAAAAVPHYAARPEPARKLSRDCGWHPAEQLAALDGGSGQNVSRSLLALWEHEYVERLLGQVEKRVLYKGSFPLIYGLTRPGAWLLRKHGYDVSGAAACTRRTSSAAQAGGSSSTGSTLRNSWCGLNWRVAVDPMSR